MMQNPSLAEDEIAFARLCKQYNQPVVFVRSMSDTTLDNEVYGGSIKKKDQTGADTLVKKCK
jgi:hypothetical protein